MEMDVEPFWVIDPVPGQDVDPDSRPDNRTDTPARTIFGIRIDYTIDDIIALNGVVTPATDRPDSGAQGHSEVVFEVGDRRFEPPPVPTTPYRIAFPEVRRAVDGMSLRWLIASVAGPARMIVGVFLVLWTLVGALPGTFAWVAPLSTLVAVGQGTPPEALGALPLVIVPVFLVPQVLLLEVFAMRQCFVRGRSSDSPEWVVA
ncbi:MAG: hypothetical protein AAGA48_21355 [Myxococcota bacterium]